MDKINEQKIIEMYFKRRPMKWISQETGMSQKVIKEYLKNNNLWTGHKYLLKYFNEFFFDNIDTEEKAYWLGFIYADGYLANPSTIGIEIKANDKEHLEKFRRALQSEHEIKIYYKNSTFGPQNNARFAFSSKHMFNILLSYYKSVHKTFEGELPKLKNASLIRHLIRGFFDGDGSLTGIPKNNEYVFRPSISFIGTKETLEYIEKLSGFHWNWSQRFPEKKTNNYQINVGRVKDSLTFLHWMYDDSTIYLDRKYQRFLYCLENRELNQAKVRV